MKKSIVTFLLTACMATLSCVDASAGFQPQAMYAPGAALPSDFVLGPTTPGKWGGATMGTAGGTVTYSYMGAGLGMDDSKTSVDLSTFMPVGYKTAIDAAFAAWSAVADIQFTEVTDSGDAFNAVGAFGDMRIGGHVFDGAGGTLAHGFFPPANGATAAGDIHFDSDELWKIGFGGPGFDVFTVMAHEIGHAIGLSHTSVAGSLMNPFYSEAITGPQADDIAGAQFIYGAASSPVPEPSSLLVFGSMMLGVCVFRRRNTRDLAI